MCIMKRGLDMGKYDAIIIGAGNSGLTCALQLVKSGKKVLLLEKNSLPGGVTTSFTRGRFEFDATLQELWDFGTKEDPGTLHKLFQDLEILDRIHFSNTKDTFHVYASDSKTDYILPFGIREFIDKMEEYVPDSRESLDDFFNLSLECKNALRYLEKEKANARYEVLLNKYPHFVEIANSSVDTVLDALHIPKKAQEILTSSWFYFGSPTTNLSFVHFASMFYLFIARGVKVSKKFSYEISLTLAEEIENGGGEIKYLSCVESILMQDGKAVGVKLTNQEEFLGDVLVCGISSNEVFGHMLPSTCVPKNAVKLTNSRVLGARGFSTYLGLNQSAKDIGLEDYSYLVMHSLDSAKEYQRMSTIENDNVRVVVMNNAIPSISPKGTCVLQFTSFFAGDCFSKMATEENYFELKEKIANHMITHFENATGITIKPYIEEIEIATPVTYAKFSGQPDGSIFGYKLTGYDNLLPRIMNEENENYIENIKFLGSFGIHSLGYHSPFLSGGQMALEILEKLEGEEKDA